MADPSKNGRRLGLLTIGALGIVYGDIGTSPLYALRECFHGAHAVSADTSNVLGVLSLITWSLIVVISLKYMLFVLRADNEGEGGVLALMVLAGIRTPSGSQRVKRLILSFGIIGSALLFGDGMLTPSLSVLSAVEGLKVATPFFTPYVVPITSGILVLLFLLQRFGTARIGAIFGPTMMIWFAVLGVLGLTGIWNDPSVLRALNPYLAYHFVATHPVRFLFILASIFLVVTGGEALYADIGHFGKKPIRISWYGIALPGLWLNYFGQGALILERPEAVASPFYHMVPSWSLYPMVGLATMATIIASQAIISGIFSLTKQAFHLGYFPRMKIVHTSEEEVGQVYVPAMNWLLLSATLLLVLSFRSSSRLAGAYGIAISLIMLITTALVVVVARRLWQWPLGSLVPLFVILLLVDFSFVAANMTKIHQGGWVPLVVAGLFYLVMMTWKKGQKHLRDRMRMEKTPFEEFWKGLDMRKVTRTRGTAVFLTGDPVGTPSALVRNIETNHVIHRKIFLLTIESRDDVPRIDPAERLTFHRIDGGVYRIIAHFGFNEVPNMKRILNLLEDKRPRIDLDETTFFVSAETVVPSSPFGLSWWRDWLFRFMRRNAAKATDYFQIPPDKIVEVGKQIKF